MRDDSGGRGLRAFRSLAGNRALLRVLAAYLLFILTEYAVWIAMIVFAYNRGGTAVAGFVAVAQLVPAAIVAPVAASIADRRSPVALLAGGYLAQTAAVGGRAVFRLDTGTDVPVVQIALLRSLPLFAELPAPAIEGPGRGAAASGADRRGRADQAGRSGRRLLRHRGGRTRRGAGRAVAGPLRPRRGSGRDRTAARRPAHRDGDRPHGRDGVPARPGSLPDHGARARPDLAAGRPDRRGAAGHRARRPHYEAQQQGS
ncbi:MAG TPA: hypothetical protein VFQ68_31810 [Streptosporangiaceae bacterium]|nr:hypothetical protein [Streptosporangiaceae bacterium]